jgi:hypothetical protein
MIDLEPLYSDRRILAEKPIEEAGVISAISQGDLDFADERRAGRIIRVKYGRRDLLIRTRSQRNSDSDQKHKP